jgi:ADP-ribose pyrophosphatase YjhB (NUDIX family)
MNGRSHSGTETSVALAGSSTSASTRSRSENWSTSQTALASLPKGKLERGESWHEAALREVREETGCTARLTSFAGAMAYEVGRGLKIVVYWNMELVRAGSLRRVDEVDEVLWLQATDAMKKLDYARERRLLARSLASLSLTREAFTAIGRAEDAFTRGEVARALRLVNAA